MAAERLDRFIAREIKRLQPDDPDYAFFQSMSKQTSDHMKATHWERKDEKEKAIKLAEQLNREIGGKIDDSVKIAALVKHKVYKYPSKWDPVYPSPPEGWTEFLNTLSSKQKATISHALNTIYRGWDKRKEQKVWHKDVGYLPLKHQIQTVGSLRETSEEELKQIEGISSKTLIILTAGFKCPEQTEKEK